MQFAALRCETPDCKHNGTGLPGDHTATMCQYSTNKIQVIPGISPGFTYVWNVTGGTINGPVLTTLSTSLSYIDVTWGNGSLGTIKVTIYNNDSSCFKVLTQKFCLTKSPKALFVKNTGDTVCKSQPITFSNTSLGVYTNWYWNFGDGVTQNGGMSVSHAYTNTGTYIVSLTVSNAKDSSNCGCSNTFYDTITVDNSTGLQILTPDCRKMLCAGDTVTYCSSITGCSTYNWSALGGTVIGSGSCIRVWWNNLTPSIINPTVTLTIPPACAGSCGNTTSLVEKILYNGMPIQGNNPVCENAGVTYTLPTLPGVFYTWSVSPAGGVTIVNGTYLNTPAFALNFTVAGTYIITCSYIDSLRNCSGISTKTIDVRPAFGIVGPTTSCVGCNSLFTTAPAAGLFNWSISTSPASVALNAPAIAHVWTALQTGTFTVSATQVSGPPLYCNSPQLAIITVAPKPVLAIFKSQNLACPGTVVKFWVTSTVTDMDVTWAYPAGTQVLNNNGPIKDTIILSFVGTGPYVVTATQQCKYTCSQTSISTSVANPPTPSLVSPQTIVCIDEVVTYTVASPVPGVVYTWSIVNPNLGTIQSPNGLPTVTILWHGNATNSGQLKVSHCGGTYTTNIMVRLPVVATISKTGNCISNGVGYTLTAGPNGQTSYVWTPGGPGQTLTNITTPGTYTVVVNGASGGSCPATKSITILPDGYRFVIAPPCVVTNCNLSSFSIPLTQLELSIPCTATLQWYSAPVVGGPFTAIPGANLPNYNATALGCYKCVATCPNGCNVTSNTICIPDDIYFCCSSAACSSLTFGIDFTSSGCAPTAFTGFYTGTGSPTGGFPIHYCYGDGTSEDVPTPNAVHQYPAAGRYTVCVATKTVIVNTPPTLNDTCCINHCDTVVIPVVAKLNASYNCNTGILSMSDASSYYPTIAGATYSWSVTGGTYTGTLGTSTSESVTPTSSGSFLVTLTVTKGTCVSTASLSVPVSIPNAAFTVNPNPTCSKDITYFNAGTLGYASYVWKFGDGAYSYSFPASNPQHQYTNNTNAPIAFTAKLIITTIDGCKDSTTQTVIVHPKPIVTVTPNPDSICRGGSVILTANINPNGNTMCTSYNYQWKKNGANIFGATSPTYAATDYGLYSVFVSGATPSCNCTMLSDTALIKLMPDPIANIETSSTVCFDPSGNPWSFNINATNYPGYTYNWTCSLGGVTFSPNNTTSGFTTATGTLTDNTNFMIYLQVVDANGCVAYDSLCVYTYKNPFVTISATGTLCANSINTISVIAPNINNNYSWNTGAVGTVINTTIAGSYNAIATNLLTGCTAFSNSINIKHAPSLQLFPIGCDTICIDSTITIPLAQLPNLSNYFVRWYDGIKPAGTLIFSGNGAITLPGNTLTLGLHHLWSVVNFPNGCNDSSGTFDVFVEKCCYCAGSSWAFKEYSIDSGATWQPWICGNPEIAIGCNTLMVNAAYNCSPGGCAGNVTGQVLDNLGNVILNIPSLPYTYTPAPGTSGSFYIKLIGWCDGNKCDSCIKQVFYNCPPIEPPCGCDTAFHFTGQPTIILPHIDEGFVAGGTAVPMNCGTTYVDSLECQKSYQFYINYQNPWPSGNCQPTVVGEVLLAGNVVYTQNNISQATPLNYVFPGNGFYCVKFKLKVNGVTCDSCTICFNVKCHVVCDCKEEFHFTGNPVIISHLPNPNDPTAIVNINFPPPIVCNTSLARPLICSTSYTFYINFTNPYSLPCVAKDSAVLTMNGNPVPLVINPNTSISNPITYTFTQSGSYCITHYLVVNGQVCKTCVVCFSVECPPVCNCNAFDFLSDPTITFATGTVKGVPVMAALSSPCETSLAKPLQCKRQYKFFIKAGAIGTVPAGCVASVRATLLFNNVAIASLINVSQANPLNYTFSKEGIYCIKYELFVNGVLCKTCTQCFLVRCCPIYYTLPPLQGNFVGCVIGGTTHIYDDSTGGTFTSLDTTVATVDNNGNVTAVGYGKAIIVYTWTRNPCDYYTAAEYSVPVLTALPAIAGSGAICRVGDSSRLTNSNTGSPGLWSSSDPTVANVSTGTTRTRVTQVRGIGSGTATITYNVLQSGCPVITTKEVIVNNVVMQPTTGPSGVCIGRSILLQNATAIPGNFSHQWLSTNTRATVNNNGVVTGVAAGAATIRYKLNYANSAFGTCSTSTDRNITVYALPLAPTIAYVTRPVFLVAATNTLCANQTFTLKGTPAGGTWSAAGGVTVTPAGVVTTTSPGTGTVTYTVYNGFDCSNSRTITYNVVACNSKTMPVIASTDKITLLNKSSKIMLFPNPAHTIVYFNVDAITGEGTVILNDVHGKELVRSSFKTGMNSIAIENYRSGMYFVTFKTKHGSQTEKLVIE